MHLTENQAKEIIERGWKSYREKDYKLEYVTKPYSEPYIKDNFENMAIIPRTERLGNPVIGLFVNNWYIYMNETFCGSYQMHIVNPYTGREHYKSDVLCNSPEEMLSRWVDTEFGKCLCYDNALLRVADMAMAWGKPEPEHAKNDTDKEEHELEFTI